jgi:hypothetical protein
MDRRDVESDRRLLHRLAWLHALLRMGMAARMADGCIE